MALLTCSVPPSGTGCVGHGPPGPAGDVPFLPDPTCPLCLEGQIFQWVGGWPPGVPFCLEHELPDGGPDSGGGDVSRRSVPTVLMDRWRLRIASSLFGWALPVVWLLLAVVQLLWSVARHPRTTGVLLGLSGLVWALVAHPLLTHLGLLLLFEGGHWWALLSPVSFRRWTRLPALARSVWLYRRKWRTAMRVAELERDVGGRLEVPRLRRVTCTPTADLVRVRGLLGQRFSEWEEAAPMLAHVFGATGFRVHRGDDRRLTLELTRGVVGRSWDREGFTDRVDL